MFENLQIILLIVAVLSFLTALCCLYFGKRVGSSTATQAVLNPQREKDTYIDTQTNSKTPFSMVSGIIFGFGFGLGFFFSVCVFTFFFGSLLLSFVSKVFSGS